jgi:hypothetical protein
MNLYRVTFINPNVSTRRGRFYYREVLARSLDECLIKASTLRSSWPDKWHHLVIYEVKLRIEDHHRLDASGQPSWYWSLPIWNKKRDKIRA